MVFLIKIFSKSKFWQWFWYGMFLVVLRCVSGVDSGAHHLYRSYITLFWGIIQFVRNGANTFSCESDSELTHLKFFDNFAETRVALADPSVKFWNTHVLFLWLLSLWSFNDSWKLLHLVWTYWGGRPMSCLLTQGKMDTDANFSRGELLPVSGLPWCCACKWRFSVFQFTVCACG